MVLTVSPHPDDVELACGGTVRRLVSQGHSVESVVLTSGEESRTPEAVSVGPDELGAVRRSETRRALSLLGVDEVHCFDLGDLALTAARVRETLSRFDDHDVVFSPPLADDHPDHVATARATREVFEGATVVEYEAPSANGGFDPDVCVDVAPYVDRKVEAVRLHRTQRHKEYTGADAVERRLLGHCGPDTYCEPFEVVAPAGDAGRRVGPAVPLPASRP